ncbi:hypothetical protein D3C84_531260 [compost metagenome]
MQAFAAGDGEIFRDFGPLRLTGERAHIDFAVQRIADPQCFECALQTQHQRIGDAVLDEQTRGRRAHLPGIPADTGDDPFNGLIEVAIVENDNRGLATQLKRQRAAMGSGAAHDLAADGVAAGERQLVETGMVAQRCADFGFTADDVQHARGQAQRVGYVAVGLLDQRRDLRRLEHHRATGGQCRCELPGTGDQREVPRHDQAHHTHRLKARVGIETRYGQRHITVLPGIESFSQACVIVKRSNGIVDVHHRFMAGFTVVLHLQRDQCFAARFDLFGKTIQISCALRATEVAPAGECLARGGNGLIDLQGTGCGELGKGLAQGRVKDGDAVDAFTGYPATVDVMRGGHGRTP